MGPERMASDESDGFEVTGFTLAPPGPPPIPVQSQVKLEHFQQGARVQLVVVCAS